MLMMSPLGRTTSRFITFSRIVPYRTAHVPDALVAAMPHSDACAPSALEFSGMCHDGSGEYGIVAG